MNLTFSIQGAPSGKGRPRFFNGHAVTPEKTRTYEALIRYEASHAIERMVVKPDFTAVCRVGIRAYFEVPQSYSRKKRNQIAESGTMQVRPGKPDLDNIIKAVLDGMNGIVYRDDVQVVRLTAEKCWCEGEEMPRVEVTVEWCDSDTVKV